jgi:YhcH/YjgK/YiaL family protein
MIYDILDNFKIYAETNKRLAVGFEWLTNLNVNTPDGRISILRDDVFAIVQSYLTFPPIEKKFETHIEHIDIQYIFEGQEIMYYAPSHSLILTEAYNLERDVAFYADPTECNHIACKAGQFAIFYPTDAHKPSCMLNKPSYVRKVVIKVKV